MPERRTIFVLNGPNLDLLGSREPEIYGRGSLKELEELCRRQAAELGFELVFRQSNAEHVLVEDIHEASNRAAGLVINPAAFTHYSYSIVDALRSCEPPIVEVHLSNLHARGESWRSKSLVSPVVRAIISGLGFEGYVAALRWVARAADEGRERP